MKQLDLYKQPQRFLEKFQHSDKKICLKIIEKIDELRSDSLPISCKKLVGHKNLYRIRVDKYRIVYRFDDEVLSILYVAKRDEVYDLIIH